MSVIQMMQRLTSQLDPRRSFAIRIGLVIILLVSFTLTAWSVVTLLSVRQSVTAQTKSAFQTKSQALERLISLFLSQKAIQLSVLAQDDSIREAIITRNNSYGVSEDDAISIVRGLDEHWIHAPPEDPFIATIVSRDRWVNPVSYRLGVFLHSYQGHSEVFATDKYGATVGATGRLSDYYQADEDWWAAGWNQGQGAVYISNPKYDESAGVFALLLAVPIINDDSGEVIGVLRSTLNVEELFGVLGKVRAGRTGYSLLLDDKGKALFDPMEGQEGNVPPPARLVHSASEVKLGSVVAGGAIWGFARLGNAERSGEPSSAAREAVNNLGWTVVFRQDSSEALAILSLITRGTLVAGLLGVAGASLAAILLTRMLTMSLRYLAVAATRIGAGDLKVALPAGGKDEIGLLASSFADMTGQMQEVVGTLRSRSFELSLANAKLEEALEAEISSKDGQRRLIAILEATTDFVAISDLEGQVLFLNASARRMMGIGDLANLSGVRTADFYPAWSNKIVLEEAIPAALISGSWEGETALLSAHGAEIPVSQVILAHRNNDGKPHLSTIARDISERKQWETRLVKLANHDGLTGLFNRRRFIEEVELELTRTRRSGSTGGILFLDLDGFKFVNDELGHRAGDELLIKLAELLRSTLRESDIIARVGGDEFSVLIPDAKEADYLAAAERVLTAVRELRLPVGDQIVRITASIGVASYPGHGLTAEELLSQADIAMYAAKTVQDKVSLLGASSVADFESASLRVMESHVREALENDGLLLYAQPIRNLTSWDTQWEVLARIRLPDGRIVPAASFLDAAERSGLIHILDREIVRRSIEFLATPEARSRQVVLEVNLSGKAFDDEELLPLIRERLKATDVSPGSLIFEITETAAITSIIKAQAFIGELRSIGCRFAIDDFGAGLSSYYLKTLPADYLKIDGSFIRNLPHDVADQHLVRSMVELARGLGKQTIAEFVGDQETVDLLREYGVDHGQGYFLGEPIPIDQAIGEDIVLDGSA